MGLVEHTLVVKDVVDFDRDNTVAVVVVGIEVAVDSTDLVEEEILEYWFAYLFAYY